MINPHLPAVSQTPPAMPLHGGRRRPSEQPFAPSLPNISPNQHPPFQGYVPARSHTQHQSPQNYQTAHHYANPHVPPVVQTRVQQQAHLQQPLVVSSYPPLQHAGHVSHKSQPVIPSTAYPRAPTLPVISTSTSPPPVFTPVRKLPFYPPLPWHSVPEEPFPPRARRRRRKQRAPQSSTSPLELPSSQEDPPQLEIDEPNPEPLVPAVAVPSEPETPLTSQAPSEIDSTHPTTPSSALPSSSPVTGQSTATPIPGVIRAVLPAIPLALAVPHLPALPKRSSRELVVPAVPVSKPFEVVPTTTAGEAQQGGAKAAEPTAIQPPSDTQPNAASHPKVPPKSWADMVRANASKAGSGANTGAANVVTQTDGINGTRAGSISEVIKSFNVDINNNDGESKITFLEPRGLVNIGNMCYMNSVLQILVFCVPFYGFLDRVGKRAAHSFKSDTPLIDAMIMFMREFQVIDSAVSVEQLKMRLKENELEQYGEAFIPEYVYNVFRNLPRFSSMQRGHQQDAEEFLGFLLERLHDECVQVIRNAGASSSSSMISTPTNDSGPTGYGNGLETIGSPTGESDGGWLEVGPKQKAAVTRSSGASTESPITKIFGGKLRSELRVPGLKNSVTLEPYQPLQLDIQSPQVNNIIDALKNLTRSETLHGDFGSPRGPGVTATKQVFIETLPPVLILHLKRFQYNNTGGTQKIWKKVGYPLELEIPKEVFPPSKRGGYAAQGTLPKYRLTGVVYHHGKNASGGHYTVDVRRQDGGEWIRLDDTVIRRLRSEDVAEGGSEEISKVPAATPESHKNERSAGGNMFEQVGNSSEDIAEYDDGWKQVNGGASSPPGSGKKSWSGVANGNGISPGGTIKGRPNERLSIKDNKVAYLLFYQGIKA